MLDALRKSTGSWIAKIFIGLLVLSFAVWGIADIFGGYGSQTVASVGETEISAESYQDEFQREVRAIGNRVGQNFTYEDARNMGLDSQVLLRLIGDAALANQAKTLGLSITGKAVAARIEREDAFKDSRGKFSQERFYRLLYANNLTEEQFLERQRRSLIAQQITQTVSGSGNVPETLLKAVNTFRNETRTLRYLTVPLDQAGAEIGEPSDAQLREYYNAHKSEFRAPETRKVGILVLKPKDLAKKVDVSEAELKEHYERNKDRLGTPERRAVLQMTFPDESSAQQAYDKLQEGADFMELAKERGLKENDVDLGLIPRSGLVDEAIAEAVFALSEGEVSKPVKGDLSTVIAKVTKIEPATGQSFEDQRDAIRTIIASQRAASTLLDTYDKIEDERAAGATLAEVAAKLDLEHVTIPAVDQGGRDANGKPVSVLAGQSRVLRGIFSADVGIETDPEETSDKGFVWYEVLGVTSERLKRFDEVKDDAAKNWRAAQERKQLSKKGQELVDRLRAGATLTEIGEETGLEVQDTKPLKRSTSDSPLPPAAIQQAFALKKGEFGSVAGKDGKSRIVFEVADTEIPGTLDEESREQVAKAFESGVGDDLVVQYVRALRNAFGVDINQSVLDNVTGRTGGAS